MEWEKIFANVTAAAAAKSLQYESLIKQNTSKAHTTQQQKNNTIKNWAKNITIGSSNLISDYSQKSWCRVSKRYLYIHVRSSVIHNS